MVSIDHWHPSAVVPLFLVLLFPSLHAQTPDQRSAVTRFRDSLGSSADIPALQALRYRVATEKRQTKSLIRGVVEHRLGELTGSRKHLDAAVGHFIAATHQHPNWAEGWYGIGLAKLELHAGGFPAKEDPYQRMGTDYLHGAAEAFKRALRVDPEFPAAAERLASSVLRQTIQPELEHALSPLRRATVGPGAANPVLHLSRGLVERELRHGDSAIASFDRYLAQGGDSGVGYLERARALFDVGRPEEAQSAYFAGAARAQSNAAVAHFRSDLAWIASAGELTRFDATTAESRAAWLSAFWKLRDVQDGRAPGERLTEHYRRLFYITRNFRLAGEQQQRRTGPGLRNLLATPAPSTEDRLRDLVRRLAATQRKLLEGAPLMAPEQQDGSAAPSDALSEAYAQLNDQSLLRAYRSDQNLVDDRGVIYIRHGEPLKRARYPGADADANESWLYTTSNAPMLFHFMGVTAPTTLVDQLPLNPALLASRGILDPRYERMADDVGRYRLQPALLEQERARSREAIATGTSTDTYPLRFRRSAESIIQAFGVRDGLDGDGHLLVVFAAKAPGLTYRRVGDHSVIAYPLKLRVSARNVAGTALYQSDTTRIFATRRVLGKDDYLTGHARIPLRAGRYEVQVTVADERWEAGTLVRRDGLVVPNLQAERLDVSDPVLGRLGSGQQWISPPDTVALNPLNAYPQGSSVQVYYQVGGMKAGHTYETRMTVQKRGGKGNRVSLDFREQARTRKAAHSRTMVLSKLAAGEYVLILTIKDVEGSASVTREQPLNVIKG